MEKGKAKFGMSTLQTASCSEIGPEPAELHLGRKKFSDECDAELTMPFTVPQQEVVDLFEDVAAEKGFEMIERQGNYATAIKKAPKAGFWELANCLNWWNSKNSLSVIKLTILQNQKTIDQHIKICRIKSLSSFSSETQDFIQTFQQNFESIKGADSFPQVFDLSSFSEDIPQEYNTNPFHLEACSHFIIHKILASDQKREKEIASAVSQALSEFQESFKNVEESSLTLPTPMKNLIGISRQTYESIRKMLIERGGSKDSETLFPFLKIAIEKYVFDRTEVLLKKIYDHADNQKTAIFAAKCRKIRQTMSSEQIFEEVLLNKKLRILGDEGQIEFCGQACSQLSKMGQTSSPREKMKSCQLMYASLKNYFFEKLNKSYQLSSMEDIIPVFITVLVFTDLPGLRSDLDMMNHFIQSGDEDFEAEKRLVINLSESWNYIVRDWKLE